MKSEDFYKCLSNDTRVRALLLLMDRKALCVCDLADALEASQPMISRHLAQLRASDIVSDHREGQWVYYSLHGKLKPWQLSVLQATQEGLRAEAPYSDDVLRLQGIVQRKQAGDCP